MTLEKQRIAIATACGWTNVKIIHRSETNKKHSGEDGVIMNGARPPSWGFGSSSIPDYLNDLNACHEMEQGLTVAQRVTYAHQMGLLLSGGSVGRAVPNWWFIHATAAEKCEAFLRTLGLWEDAQ